MQRMMQRGWTSLLKWSALGLCAVSFMMNSLSAGEKVEEGFESIFDGKTLKGWDGNPKFWSVKDGAITGQTTKENPTKGNTFIIWDGKLADFELRLQYKIVNGNSGIQYRSYPAPNQPKWVIAGYQADFEAGNTYSGILYSEKERGILCLRGQKTVVGENHKPKTVGKIGETKELQKHIKKEDWNEYKIVAKGFHFQHYINGQLMSDCTDEDQEKRRDSGLLALQLHAGPAMTVQFRNIRVKHLKAEKTTSSVKQDSKTIPVIKKGESKKKPQTQKRVALISGLRSHGYGSHEHYAGNLLLAKCLKEGMPNFETIVFSGGWPKAPNALDGFHSIVMYCDGGGRHMANAHLDEVDQLAKQGVGIVCIHYGVEVPKGKEGDKFLEWIGGYFETNWSVNPHWTANFTKFPKHPITNGVKPFAVNDEWYYHMRFVDDLKNVTPILSDLPGPDTLKRPNGPHSGNEAVRKAIANKEVQHVAWAFERKNGGRGFGFTGGHNHWNWGNDMFRRTVLNAIVWSSGAEVPAGGVPLTELSVDDLMKNQDYPAPKGFNKAEMQKRLDEWNKTETTATNSAN